MPPTAPRIAVTAVLGGLPRSVAAASPACRQADYAPPPPRSVARPDVCPMERPISACYCHDRNNRRGWGHAN
jgi:hypothetical protein